MREKNPCLLEPSARSKRTRCTRDPVCWTSKQCIFPALRNPIEMMLTLLFRDQLVQCSLLNEQNGKNGVASMQLGKLISHSSPALARNCLAVADPG